MAAPPASLRAAAIIHLVNGVGFGVFIPAAIAHLRKHGQVLEVFGFPAYGGGPFESRGVRTTVPLLLAFLTINALFVVAGMLVWRAALGGAILSLALLIPGTVFWWGFALPFGPLLGLASAVLLLANWRSLS